MLQRTGYSVIHKVNAENPIFYYGFGPAHSTIYIPISPFLESIPE